MHKAEARLLDGMRLDELMDTHAREYQFEGSLLNYVINPVTIGDVRGFTDWAGGGYAVLEEAFPSRNYVEFCLLHVPAFVDGLFAIHRAQRKDPSQHWALLLDPHAFSDDFWERACMLLHRLPFQRRVHDELARRGLLATRTAQEAEELVSIGMPTGPQERPADDLELLRDLAVRRFAHLGFLDGASGTSLWRWGRARRRV